MWAVLKISQKSKMSIYLGIIIRSLDSCFARYWDNISLWGLNIDTKDPLMEDSCQLYGFKVFAKDSICFENVVQNVHDLRNITFVNKDLSHRH